MRHSQMDGLRMRHWLLHLLSVVSVAAASIDASAACRQDSRTLALVLGQTSGLPMTSGVRFTRAGAYLNAGCLTKAKIELDRADSALSSKEPAESDFRTRKRAQEALRAYADALQMLEDGKRQAAVDALFKLLDSSRSGDVMWRTTITLGDLLSTQSKADEWERFSQSLNQLGAGEARFWQVDLYKRLKEVRDGKSAVAIGILAEELSQDLPAQRGLALKVVLTEVLLADGRYANARMHCSFIESDVAEGLLDIELRLRYLRTCSAAWRKPVSGQNNEQAARALRVFDATIRKFEEET